MTDQKDKAKQDLIRTLRGDPAGEDIFGRLLYPGDFIVYGVNDGTLKIGQVVQVKEKDSRFYNKLVQIRTYRRQYDVAGKSISWKRGSLTQLTRFKTKAYKISTDDIPTELQKLIESS